MTPKLRAAVEYGPLGVFFVTFWVFDIFTATAAIMAATVVALAIALVLERRLPIMPLVTGGLIMVFGGLTIWLQDETFFKIKPTIVYLMFTAILLGGLALGRPLLKPLLGRSLRLDEPGWSRLTRRFALFFVVMAGLNEAVWRTQTTEFWVSYKVFGSIGLMFAFFITQAPLITRHQLPGEDAETGPPDQ